MTEPDDPSRLADSPAAPAGLKSALRAAQSDLGSDERVARLAGRLAPLLGVGVAASAGTGAGAAVGTGATAGAAKLGLAAIAALAAAGGAWLLLQPPAASPRAPSAPASTITAALPVGKPPPELPASAPAEVPSEVAPSLAPLPSAVPEKPLPPALPSEPELLERARAALKSDPNRALQLASEHARRFPHGVLVQEREVLAIQALRRLGRDAEADRRADAFAKAFPGSAFQRKLKPNP